MRESRTDAVLVKDAVSGDDGAFAALAERHLPDVRRRIARVIADPDDVGDLAQDVLMHALTRLHELRQPDRFGAWLGSIAMNAARDLRRRRVRQLRLEERFAAEGAPVLHAPVLQVGLSDELTEARVRRERVRRALARLSAPQRDVVVHHYVKGYSYLETAELLGLGVTTVRSRLQKARRKLRREIEEMSTERNTERYELSSGDLEVMRLAMRIVNPEHPNPVVRGIYLDAGGSVVATDGHRLFRATAPGLASLAAPLVLAPVAQRELPVADGAVLSIDSNEAILRFPDGNGCTFPVCDDAYVPYEKVIPRDAPIRASVSADDLLEALAQLADHLEARHPVEPDGDWKYLPAVLVRLAADQPSLQLVTAREIGYVPREPGSEAQGSPVRSPVDWKFSVTIAAEVVLAEGTFGIALDFRYLCDAVESLSGTLDLAFASKTDPVVLRSRDDPERLAVIMPMAQRA